MGRKSVIAVVLALVIGFVLGAAASGGDEADDEREAAPAAAQQLPPPVEEIRPEARRPAPPVARAREGSGGGAEPRGGGAEPRGGAGQPLAPYLQPPTSLVVRAGRPSDTTLDISWNQPGFADRYDVYRWDAGSGRSTLVRDNKPGRFFTDRNLTPGVTYYYNLCARRRAPRAIGLDDPMGDIYACYEGGWVSGTTSIAKVAAPTVLGLSMVNNGRAVRVQWTQPCVQPCPKVNSFEIYKYTASTGITARQVGSGSTIYDDSEIQPRTTYSYLICATGNGGQTCMNSWRTVSIP
ncbi:MAG TPA: fibronectin type III domain-containing protein [Thermoleophilaceae bacterium]